MAGAVDPVHELELVVTIGDGSSIGRCACAWESPACSTPMEAAAEVRSHIEVVRQRREVELGRGIT